MTWCGKMTDSTQESEAVVDNTIENKFTHLEGEYQPSEQKTRIFNTLTELTDYISAFRIENGQYAKGVLRDNGRTVFQLTFLNEDL